MLLFFCGFSAGAFCAALFWSRTVSQMQHDLNDAHHAAFYWESACARMVRRELIQKVCDN